MDEDGKDFYSRLTLTEREIVDRRIQELKHREPQDAYLRGTPPPPWRREDTDELPALEPVDNLLISPYAKCIRCGGYDSHKFAFVCGVCHHWQPLGGQPPGYEGPPVPSNPPGHVGGVLATVEHVRCFPMQELCFTCTTIRFPGKTAREYALENSCQFLCSVCNNWMNEPVPPSLLEAQMPDEIFLR